MPARNALSAETQITRQIRLNHILVETNQILIGHTAMGVMAGIAAGAGEITGDIPLNMQTVKGKTLVSEDTAALMTTITKRIGALILSTP